MCAAPSSLRVLIVEDDDSIATAIGYLLHRQGFERQRAATGAEALHWLERFQPDLVLLDIVLPDLTGYEICDRVRRDPAHCHRKILMMTARGTAAERRRALEHGADGFLTKPFALAGLRAELTRLLPQLA